MKRPRKDMRTCARGVVGGSKDAQRTRKVRKGGESSFEMQPRLAPLLLEAPAAEVSELYVCALLVQAEETLHVG